MLEELNGSPSICRRKWTYVISDWDTALEANRFRQIQHLYQDHGNKTKRLNTLQCFRIMMLWEITVQRTVYSLPRFGKHTLFDWAQTALKATNRVWITCGFDLLDHFNTDITSVIEVDGVKAGPIQFKWELGRVIPLLWSIEYCGKGF